MRARLVRQLRGIASRQGWLPDSVKIDIDQILSPSVFVELSSKQVASLLTSSSILRDRFPSDLNRKLLESFSDHCSMRMLETLSNDDFGTTVLSFGFLVQRQLSVVDHTRAGELVLQSAIDRFSSQNVLKTKTLRNILKGVSLLRLPMSAKLVNFYKDFPNENLSFDERVYCCKSAIDYGLLPNHIRAIINEVPKALSSKTASSLLYCMAMAGVTCDTKNIQELLKKSTRESLIPIWSSHLLGLPVTASGDIKRVEEALLSADARDRAMASSVLGLRSTCGSMVKQSVQHEKLFDLLQAKYGALEVEYEVLPGLVVDCASLTSRIAFELQGPSHYLFDLEGQRYILNGPTRFKNARIENAGWEVLNVDLTDSIHRTSKTIHEIRFS